MSDFAAYRFLPWVRTGFRPTTEDPLDGAVPDASRFDLTVDVTGRGEAGETTESESVTLSMYGPGEVTGIDGRQVVRREPEPNTPDFTPNYFPVVEFDQPDLPWLFSPGKADGQGRVRPWVALVTVEQRDGVTLGTAGDRKLQALEWAGAADPTRDLPDLSESWAWAHAQVVGGPDATTTERDWVGAQLDDNTTAAVSRLVSPRRLAPKTSYWACVVPTFEPGRLVGLGEDLPDDGSGIGPAWDHETELAPFRLPVYLSWEFTTGAAGDFESLVRRLDPTTLSGIGVRAMDASHPGPAELEEHRPRDVSLDGALTSIGLDRTDYPDRNREDLAALLAETGLNAATDDPTLGPPVYARYHADAPGVPDASTVGEHAPWLRELNLEPRARVAAGLGAAVVRDRQESLMTSAWKQIGDVRRANQLLERAQLARAASRAIHEDVRALSGPDVLAVSSPIHGRVRRTDGAGSTTVDAHVAESCLPTGAVSTGFRRLTRPAGPLGTRLSSTTALAPDAVVGRLNDPSFLLETETPPDGTNELRRGDPRTETDLGAEVCTRIGQRPDPRTGGWTPEMVSPIDPDDVVDVLEEACDEGRQRVADARDRLEEGSPADDVLRTIESRCAALCGEDGPIERYARAVTAVDGASTSAAVARAERDAIAALSDVIEALAAARDSLRALDRLLAGDPQLPGDVVEGLRETHAALREHCEKATGTVRDRAYDHLAMLCARLGPAATKLDEAVDEGDDATERVDALVATISGICGPSDGSSGGLLEALDAHLSGSWLFASVTALFADLERLVALASDRATALADDLRTSPGGEAAGTLAGLFADFETHLDAVADGIAEIPRDPIRDRLRPTVCGSVPTADPSAGTPLPGVTAGGDLHTRLVEALDPGRTVPARIADRLGGLDLYAREDPLDRVMAAPEFPQAMYAALRDYGQQFFLPGSGDVPAESIGLLETNPAFVEAYMAGLNHEFARELQWREYPTDKRGTYFRQFWDVSGRVPPVTDANREAFTDIDPMHEWPVGDDATPLGGNLKDKPGGGDDAGTNLVVTIRGDLLRRYPNTVVYLVEGSWVDGERVPAIEADQDAPDPSADYVRYPQFQGELDPDIRFLGFALTATRAVGSTDPAADDPGWFVVVEEAPGEPRFGLDVNDGDVGAVPAGVATDAGGPRSPGEGEESGWDALSWGHVVPPGNQSADDPFAGLDYVPVDDTAIDDDGWSVPSSPVDWGENGAHMAAITWQPPVRIAIHADDMIDTEEL